MANSEPRLCIRLSLALMVWCAGVALVHAQDQSQGFAVERFYPAPPGSAWLVMDDLNMKGGLGGAVSLSSSYSHDALVVPAAANAGAVPLIANAVFIDVGLAGTYSR